MKGQRFDAILAIGSGLNCRRKYYCRRAIGIDCFSSAIVERKLDSSTAAEIDCQQELYRRISTFAVVRGQ